MKIRALATMLFKGLAKTKNGPPKIFCSHFKVPASARYELTYGEQDAHTMAQGWAHRMDYFYRIWCDRGNDVFSAADIAGYEELPSFAELAASSKNPKMQARVEQTRRLFATPMA